MEKMVVVSDEKQDFINKLSNDVLTFILSKLQVDEAVRCNILSKRWVGLWKQAHHIEFNAKQMIMPITQLIDSRESNIPKGSDFLSPFLKQGVCKYGFLIFKLMYHHSGELSSCRFIHFKESLLIGEVNSWIEFLVKKKKGLKHLSLECLLDYGEAADEIVFGNEIHNPHFSPGIFNCLHSLELINYTIDCWYAFEGCKNLKILKLEKIHLDGAILCGILENCVLLETFSLIECTGVMKLIIRKSNLKVLRLRDLCLDHLKITTQNLDVLFLDSITCPVKNLSIFAPRLHNFETHWYSMLLVKDKKCVMKTYEILACVINLWMQKSCSIFQNLSTFSMDLDLNNIEEVMDLSFALRLCTSLQVLDITLPAYGCKYSGGCSPNDNSALPFPLPMFWERQELCNTINQKLKFVCIKGFRGKEQEMQFAKHLITRAIMMKRITIICNDSTEVAENLFSVARASGDLCINLKINAHNNI